MSELRVNGRSYKVERTRTNYVSMGGSFDTGVPHWRSDLMAQVEQLLATAIPPTRGYLSVQINWREVDPADEAPCPHHEDDGG